MKTLLALTVIMISAINFKGSIILKNLLSMSNAVANEEIVDRLCIFWKICLKDSWLKYMWRVGKATSVDNKISETKKFQNKSTKLSRTWFYTLR